MELKFNKNMIAVEDKGTSIMMEFPLLAYSGFISILSFFSGGKTNDWEGGKRGGGDDLEPLEEMKTIWSRDDICHRHHKQCLCKENPGVKFSWLKAKKNPSLTAQGLCT